MRVIRVAEFGGPEVLVLEEVPDPVAAPGQVVIDVTAADTLWVETLIRRGLAGRFFDVRPPYVPGGGVAGQVRAVGEGVDPGRLGRRVVTYTGGGNSTGGYAERVAATADQLVEVPEGLGLPEAAALLHDGVTALSLYDAARIRPGQRVLVTAAGGGLGILLVQLAHAAGARVAAAARGERKLALARDLGADFAVDYTTPDWAERVREWTGGRGLDVVFDGAGGEIGRAAYGITAPGGQFSAHGAPGGFVQVDAAEAARDEVTVRGIEHVRFALDGEQERLVARALAEAAAGRLRPVIGQTFPLEKAADAHTAIEARQVVGKTLLLI